MKLASSGAANHAELLEMLEPRLSAAESRLVIRRQLVGSVAAAVAVIIFAALAAFKAPDPGPDPMTAAPRQISTVQQPIFVTPAGEYLAALQR